MEQQAEVKPKIRVRQTADERHSEEAQKKRRVNFEDVQDIGTLLKFRFIAQKLPIEEVKKYFDYEGEWEE